ncbi:MAG TPA: hypothetical protein VEB64_07965 [Azospirillaceae bacterium]|nr:hypothetical protein [Azospirillaceae bacterium]
MTLGLYDTERRYRRRVWVSAVKTGLYVMGLVGTGLFAYQMGVEQIKARDGDLREEVSQLSRQKSELQLLASQLQTAARTAETKAVELEARVAKELPVGETARLSKLVAERLVAGVDPNRLAFVIAAAQNQKTCQAAETKRFVLPTPIFKAPNRTVGFAGLITITGEGQPARDSAGNPEGWFDPSQPVTIKFSVIGGRGESVTTGTLPLHHSVVVDNTEHRFTITASARSFVEVTGDRCAYP